VAGNGRHHPLSPLYVHVIAFREAEPGHVASRCLYCRGRLGTEHRCDNHISCEIPHLFCLTPRKCCMSNGIVWERIVFSLLRVLRSFGGSRSSTAYRVDPTRTSTIRRTSSLEKMAWAQAIIGALDTRRVTNTRGDLRHDRPRS
jgi:hypothetical protein